MRFEKKTLQFIRKLKKKFKQMVKILEKKSCNSDQKALRKLNIGISKAPT